MFVLPLFLVKKSNNLYFLNVFEVEEIGMGVGGEGSSWKMVVDSWWIIRGVSWMVGSWWWWWVGSEGVGGFLVMVGKQWKWLLKYDGEFSMDKQCKRFLKSNGEVLMIKQWNWFLIL